ncbi:hypothetical protein EVG20_g8548, partial [Dentipellis fragilis]
YAKLAVPAFTNGVDDGERMGSQTPSLLVCSIRAHAERVSSSGPPRTAARPCSPTPAFGCVLDAERGTPRASPRDGVAAVEHADLHLQRGLHAYQGVGSSVPFRDLARPHPFFNAPAPDPGYGLLGKYSRCPVIPLATPPPSRTIPLSVTATGTARVPCRNNARARPFIRPSSLYHVLPARGCAYTWVSQHLTAARLVLRVCEPSSPVYELTVLSAFPETSGEGRYLRWEAQSAAHRHLEKHATSGMNNPGPCGRYAILGPSRQLRPSTLAPPR